jgi:hypothetical protein
LFVERQQPKEGEEVFAMVNKDQLEQTSEGKQVLALMAEHFTDEQFQPALTLIEQRYTEDLTVWDAELNHDSKLSFEHTDTSQRLLVFFDSPERIAKIKDELADREAEHAMKQAEGPAVKVPAAAKPRAKGKAKTKASGSAQRARRHKVKTAKAGKKKPLKRQRSKPPTKRPKQKSRPAKALKSRAKKNRKVSKSKKS